MNKGGIKKHKLNCQCLPCKNKRKESHNFDCQCCSCKSKRGELKGRNHPNFGKIGYWGDKKNPEQSKRMKGNNPMESLKSREKVGLSKKNKKFSEKHIKNLSKSHKGKLSGRKGKHHSDETKEKLRKNPAKHHIYLKENSDKIIILNKAIHIQLHYQAYRYIYKRYGKKGIDDYLKWFDKNYGLKIKNDNKKQIIVYAYVCGDIIHLGHLKHLEFSKRQGDFLIVGVLTKSAIMEKKLAPILSYKERAKIIESIKYVDLVVIQKTYSPIPNILKIKPDIMMESTSHKEEDIKKVIEVVKSYGGKVIIAPYHPEQSSTKIKEKIKGETK